MKLLIVGAGHLAVPFISQIKLLRPRTEITAVTATDKRHPELTRLGAKPQLASDQLPRDFHRIVISVPPSRVEDPAAFLENWNGHLGPTGLLWLVSSTGVYAESQGGWVDESSPVDPSHPLMIWENFCNQVGAGVLRLAGLYDADRGPHRVYQRSTVRPGFGGEYVNLIHTEDGARVLLECVYGGKASLRVGADGEPLTRDELAFLSARLIGQNPPCRFEESTGRLGKRVRSTIPMSLRYGSFKDWAKEQFPKL